MRYLALTADGKQFTLTVPISVVIQSSEDAPADGFSGVFAIQDLPACTFFQIYQGDDLLFDGLIDSQVVDEQQNRNILRIEARSWAALLLDNEALPQTYENPSWKMLFSRHAAPYGFRYEGTDLAVAGTMTVSKGMSEWQVLEQFCTGLWGKSLSAGRDRMLYVGKRNLTAAVFGEGGIPVLSKKIRFRNSVLYSGLMVKDTKGKTWSLYAEDSFAQRLGIRRVRYLNTDTDARQVFEKASRRYLEITLWCPGCIMPEIGTPVKLTEMETLWKGTADVAGWSYQFASGQESTRIVLRAGR